MGLSHGVPIARSLRQVRLVPQLPGRTGCRFLGAAPWVPACLWPAVSVRSLSATCRVGGPGHEPGKTKDTCGPRLSQPQPRGGERSGCAGRGRHRGPRRGLPAPCAAGRCEGVSGPWRRLRSSPQCPWQGLLDSVQVPLGVRPRSAPLLSLSLGPRHAGWVSSGRGLCADCASPNPGRCACPGRPAQEAGAPSPRGGRQAGGHGPALLLGHSASLGGGTPGQQPKWPFRTPRAPHRPTRPGPGPGLLTRKRGEESRGPVGVTGSLHPVFLEHSQKRAEGSGGRAMPCVLGRGAAPWGQRAPW